MIHQTIKVKNIEQTIPFSGSAAKTWYVEVVSHSNLPAPTVKRVGGGTMDLVWPPRCLNLEIEVIFHTEAETAEAKKVAISKRVAMGMVKGFPKVVKNITLSLAVIGVFGLILGVLAIAGINEPHKLWQRVPTVSSISTSVQESTGFKTAFNSHPFFNSELSWKYTTENQGKRLKDIFQWVGKYDDGDMFIEKNLLIMTPYDGLVEYCDRYPMARPPKYEELEFVSDKWTTGWRIESLGPEWTSNKRFLWGNYKVYTPPGQSAELMALASRIEDAEGAELDSIAIELGAQPRGKEKDGKFRRKLVESATLSRTSKVHHKSWFEDGVYWLNADETLQGRCVIVAGEDDWKK